MTRKNIKLVALSSCIHGATVRLDIPKSHIFYNIFIENCYSYFNNFRQVFNIVQVLKGLEEWLEERVEDAKKSMELEQGIACLIPKARLEALQEVLEHVRRL